MAKAHTLERPDADLFGLIAIAIPLALTAMVLMRLGL